MYISKIQWRDLEDGHLYNAGEPFPHDGREIPAERIETLTGTQNKAGFAVIQAVDEPEVQKPVEQSTPPKKAVRRAKKAT